MKPMKSSGFNAARTVKIRQGNALRVKTRSDRDTFGQDHLPRNSFYEGGELSDLAQKRLHPGVYLLQL